MASRRRAGVAAPLLGAALVAPWFLQHDAVVCVSALAAPAAARRTRPGKPRTYFRRVAWDRVEFGGALAIDAALPGVDARRFEQHYVTPRRVVSAAWDPAMVEALDDHHDDETQVFRLRQAPFDFAGALRVETFVDVAVKRAAASGALLELRSRGIDLRGAVGAQPPRRMDVDIDLRGQLDAQRPNATVARVSGAFEFDCRGTLVGPLVMLPDPILAAAADAVILGVVTYAEGRFVRGVKASYQQWVLAAARGGADAAS